MNTSKNPFLVPSPSSDPSSDPHVPSCTLRSCGRVFLGSVSKKRFLEVFMRPFKGIPIFLLLVSFKAQAAEGKPTGWWWYKDPRLEKGPLTSPKVHDSSTLQAPLTAVERLALLQKHFEEVKAKAVLEPTLENVAAVRRVHAQILRLSSTFSDRWMEAELLDPTDEILPTSPGAVKIARQEQEKNVAEKLKEMARTHVLLLVFSQSCPYCESFAPLVLEFARTYGFKVEGLSSTAGCLKGFTCTQNAQAVQILSPQGQVPLLLMVHPQTHQVYPLARGTVNWNDLHHNASYLISALKGQTP